MSKPYARERGFTSVETVLVAVIVVLIVAVGWLVYKNHQKTTTTSASVATVAKTPAQQTEKTSSKTSQSPASSVTLSQPSQLSDKDLITAAVKADCEKQSGYTFKGITNLSIAGNTATANASCPLTSDDSGFAASYQVRLTKTQGTWSVTSTGQQ